MKKYIASVLTAVMLFSLAACGASAPANSGGWANEPPSVSTDTFELALVTDMGTVDDKSFNQGSWEGMKRYADENGITHKFYQPSEQSDDAYLNSIDLAITGGAKLVVLPGFLFANPVGRAQENYPDIHFIIVDSEPTGGAKENTVGIGYAEHQSGFLAGYAAVKDGYRKLGFMGGLAVPAVMNYGYGFIQGAEYAAAELGLGDYEVTINYHYTGGFDATPEVKAMSASWYNNGVEIIFGCGGAVGSSVMAAAEEVGKFVIGVDVDQSGESETVVTSAMKGLSASVYACVKDYYEGSFPGGQFLVFNAENDGVEIAMDTARFKNFTQADYDAIYEKLKTNEIKVIDFNGTIDGMGLKHTSVTVVE